MGGRVRLAELTVLALVVCAGCGGGVSQAPRFAASHRIAAPPEAVCEDLSRAAFANGRELVLVQPARARFVVRAHFADRFGAYTFAVECLPDRVVAVRAYGPRVEPVGTGRGSDEIMPQPLREELLAFTQNVRAELVRLETGGEPWAHDPPRRSPGPPPAEVAGIHADRGMVAVGGLSLAASYLVGSFTSLGLAIECERPYLYVDCMERVAALAFVPLGHWAAGFSGSETAGWAIASGVVFSALELVSIIVMFAGAAHHRAGPVALSGPGTLTISF
jgi:hypothetical protein